MCSLAYVRLGVFPTEAVNREDVMTRGQMDFLDRSRIGFIWFSRKLEDQKDRHLGKPLFDHVAPSFK